MSNKREFKREGLLFSKMLVVISFGFFFWVIWTLINLPEGTMASGMGTVYTAMITASGAMCVTSVVWYLKKTHVGYTAKVQKEQWQSALKYRLIYNQKMMKYQHDFKLTDSEVAKIENQSKMQAIEEGAFRAASDTVSSAMSEGSATIKKETL
ncbi:MAG: hypothetical protein VB030_02945 [Eubacterium aggregans]|uniref:hypothetical protein n=1 Tax=Eubacterium aggregans TaxID=81409 RepID=UPI002B208430|nr:hypothetical protein [Eubacterium aggregans]MEA5073109.1 hypothetical protein [Eubacterium aggregans]